MRAAVAGVLGPQLALDALAEPETDAEVIAEALAELALASQLDDTDIVLRHHRAVLLALRYVLHSGPDEDYETAGAELTALLEEPDYQELAGDLARLLLVQLRGAHLGVRRGHDPVAALDGTDAFKVATRTAVEDISRHLSQLSARARQDDSVSALSGMFATISTFLGNDHPDPARALDEAIARAEHGLTRSEDEHERMLHAALLAAARNQKALISRDSTDVAAARAAAENADALLRDDIPLASQLRDFLAVFTQRLEHSPADRGAVAREIAVVCKALHQLDASDPVRAHTFSSFVGTMASRIGRSGDLAGMADLREFVEQESSAITDEGVRHLARGMIDVLESALTEDPAAMSAGLASLEEARRTLSPQHRAYPLIDRFIAMALGLRGVSGRSLLDLESAHRVLESAQENTPDHDQTGTKLSKLGVMMNSLRHGAPDAAKISEIIDQARELTDAEQQQLRGIDLDVSDVISTLEYMRELVGSFGKPVTPPPRALPGPGKGYFDLRHDDRPQASALVHNGFVTRDLDMLDRGIALLRAETTANPRDRIRLLMVTGISCMFRYSITTKLADLDQAVEQIEEAERLVDHTDASDAAGVHFFLGEALHMRGNRRLDRADRARAAEHGILAMKARASEVLLQSNADHALTIAETATGEAETVVQWCVLAERHDLAVHALELGRSLVLHSVSVESSIPDLLRDAGHSALAERWKTEAAVDAQRVVPSDLRFQVLNALAGTKVESQLLRPPSLDDIRTALVRTESQALVYLLPASSPVQPGFALVVPAAGDVRHVRLPNLRSGPVREFEEARRTLIDPSPEDEKLWQDAVASMCDWSWRAVMGPLLDDLRGLPRIVVVPVGELSAVPWHAARRQVGGEIRHACQDAIITYAASARQFVDAARRDRRPVDAAATLVRVQDRELYWPPAEIATLRDHCYPDATCVEDGVLPGEVLGHLPSDLRPGASVLHLSCHACHATPAVDSHLVLDDGEVLPVRDVLRQARNRPVDAEGGLVVLASCASDLTDSAHDEALTLATAFLAAGATGVVGARWPIVDVTTTLFVIMFHHYLTRGYDDPARALRATQLWMLDPKRRVPPDVPRALARCARSFPLDDAGNWAAFTYQGR